MNDINPKSGRPEEEGGESAMIAEIVVTNWPQAIVYSVAALSAAAGFIAFCMALNGSNFPWDKE